MPGAEITHAQDPRRAAADGRRHVQTQDRGQPIDRRDGGRRLHAAGAAGRPELAAARGPDRRGAGAPSVPAAAMRGRRISRPQPDWAAIHRELKRPGVTLQLLWEEHRGGASRRLRLQPVLRALPRLGGAAVADHAADACRRRAAVRRLRRHDAGGDRRQRPARCMTAQLFVAVLGASSYTYAEATWTQAPGRLDRLAHARLRVLRRRRRR